MRALHDVPAVVAAEVDLVDLLPEILADVAEPELAAAAIEAPAATSAKLSPAPSGTTMKSNAPKAAVISTASVAPRKEGMR